MAVQADGKVLLGGHTLTRLHPGGEPDSSFKVELRDRVQAIALDAQGRIYIGGGFAEVNGQVRNRLARLFRTGALDPRADPGAGPPLT